MNSWKTDRVRPAGGYRDRLRTPRPGIKAKEPRDLDDLASPIP